MERLTLSSTVRLSSGYNLPILGLGVYQNHSCIPAVEAALKHGYRHIDTAQMYGNESDVGKAVQQSGLKREDIFVSCPYSIHYFFLSHSSLETSYIGDTTKIYQNLHGSESTLRVVEESLAKLGFSYIDLYLIHSPLSGNEKRLQTYVSLLQKRNEGKIRTVGVSNYGIHHLEEIKEAGLETPAVNQIELHPFNQQKPIVEYCRAHGIVVQAFCPLVRGYFSNPVLQRIVKKIGKDPAQVLIRWSLQKGFIPLPKSSRPDRVTSNADVYNFELSEEDISALDALDKGDAGAISWNPVNAP